MPQETLTEFQNFSYGIYGEGETSLFSLIECLSKGNFREADLANIHRLIYRNNGRFIVNLPRERLSSEELSNLPYPVFDQYYKSKNALSSKDDDYVMISSRGCPYRCIFCMQVLGHQIRRRSAESVVDEMEYAIDRYGAHTIYFYDEIFLFNDHLTYDVLELMKKQTPPTYYYSTASGHGCGAPPLSEMPRFIPAGRPLASPEAAARCFPRRPKGKRAIR